MVAGSGSTYKTGEAVPGRLERDTCHGGSGTEPVGESKTEEPLVVAIFSWRRFGWVRAGTVALGKGVLGAVQ
jgi:hypothetical protein